MMQTIILLKIINEVGTEGQVPWVKYLKKKMRLFIW